jgi:hypothetical protein
MRGAKGMLLELGEPKGIERIEHVRSTGSGWAGLGLGRFTGYRGIGTGGLREYRLGVWDG